MATWITICDTCKRDDFPDRAPDVTDGESLARQIEPLAAQAGIPTRRVSCLMGCTHGCNIAIQANGKLNYTLGRFDPADPEAAPAIVDYARQHSESDTGRVPFRDWPQGVKGHFVTRHPPLPPEG